MVRLGDLSGRLFALLFTSQRASVDGGVPLWNLISEDRWGAGCSDVTVVFRPLVPLAPDAIQESLQRSSRSRFSRLQ